MVYGGYKFGGYVNDNVISLLIEWVSGVKGVMLGMFLYDVFYGDIVRKLLVIKLDFSYGISVFSIVVKVVELKFVYLKGDVIMDGCFVG